MRFASGRRRDIAVTHNVDEIGPLQSSSMRITHVEFFTATAGATVVETTQGDNFGHFVSPSAQ
ncbi:hypothetical protein DA70_09605 [Pandoraea pnomenusa]|nr:hypothetical protein DA70_09605 [Pandoraea pnomenusa]